MGYDASVVFFYGIRVNTLSEAATLYCQKHNLTIYDKTGYDTKKEHRAYYLGYRLDEIRVTRTDDGMIVVPKPNDGLKNAAITSLSYVCNLPSPELWAITEHSY